MFFVFRLVFWLGLVLVLLPREPEEGKVAAPQLGAVEAISAASAAVSDMSGFCSRQPAACEVGGQAAAIIGERAQGGARKVYQYLIEQKSEPENKQENKRAPDHTGSIGSGTSSAESAAANIDTLTEDDREYRWQDPSSRADAADHG